MIEKLRKCVSSPGDLLALKLFSEFFNSVELMGTLKTDISKSIEFLAFISCFKLLMITLDFSLA